ncbi:MAG: Lrp/AsnC ligand binding domain-containing protein [Candidatus Hadarchaeales archaeon]|nr:MAG: Lrp/AsnC family transcriptional regulator [Hadesarchaea archaeon]
MSADSSPAGRSYVLVEVEPGKEEYVIPQLRKMPNVTMVDFVHGDYDVVCVLEGPVRDVDRTVIEIRRIPYIRRTVTLTAFRARLK